MAELTDAEALAHYRDELNRTRTAIKALAEEMDAIRDLAGGMGKLRPTPRLAAVVADDLYRILGERP